MSFRSPSILWLCTLGSLSDRASETLKSINRLLTLWKGSRRFQRNLLSFVWLTPEWQSTNRVSWQRRSYSLASSFNLRRCKSKVWWIWAKLKAVNRWTICASSTDTGDSKYSINGCKWKKFQNWSLSVTTYWRDSCSCSLSTKTNSQTSTRKALPSFWEMSHRSSAVRSHLQSWVSTKPTRIMCHQRILLLRAWRTRAATTLRRVSRTLKLTEYFCFSKLNLSLIYPTFTPKMSQQQAQKRRQSHLIVKARINLPQPAPRARTRVTPNSRKENETPQTVVQTRVHLTRRSLLQDRSNQAARDTIIVPSLQMSTERPVAPSVHQT